MFRKASTPESRLKARDDAALMGERINDVKAFFKQTDPGQLIAIATIAGGLILAGYVEGAPM